MSSKLCAALLAVFTLCASVPWVAACSSASPEPPRSAPRSGRPVQFSYGTPRGESLSSQTTRGRVTALLFVTTFDLPSQVMAKRLDVVVRRHRPRANAGAIALEAPNDAPLVDVFRTSLALSYPVALTNSTRLGEQGPFGAMDQVPVLVILDSRGVEVNRATGLVSESEIDEALTDAVR